MMQKIRTCFFPECTRLKRYTDYHLLYYRFESGLPLVCPPLPPFEVLGIVIHSQGVFADGFVAECPRSEARGRGLMGPDGKAPG